MLASEHHPYDNGYRLTAQTLGNGLNRTINYDRNGNPRASDLWSEAPKT